MRQYGNIQEVIVQNFRTKPDTAMRAKPDADLYASIDTRGGPGPARRLRQRLRRPGRPARRCTRAGRAAGATEGRPAWQRTVTYSPVR